jgi:hypothetical protein
MKKKAIHSIVFVSSGADFRQIKVKNETQSEHKVGGMPLGLH